MRRAAISAGAAAALVGGAGNVLFAAHDGTQLAFIAARFISGLLIAQAAVLVLTPPAPEASVRLRLTVATAAAASPVLLIMSAGMTTVVSFTVASAATPAIAAVIGRAVGAERAHLRDDMLALIAVLAAAYAAVLAAGSGTGRQSTYGILLAACGAFMLASATVGASKLKKVHPATQVRDMCAAGCVISAALTATGWATGAESLSFDMTRTTLWMAVLVAAGPGGAGKAAIAWAAARTAPHLVAATMPLSIIPAAALSYLILGQELPASAVAACAAAAAATAAVALSRREAEKPAAR